MKQAGNMRNISRVDQESKSQHGWLVRIMRGGVTYQKFISDGAHRGRNNSLRAARSHRDEMLREYPPQEHGNVFDAITARNTSRHPGVSKSGSYRKGTYYEVWQAHWTLPDGRRMSKKFGFSEGGRTERQAKRLAIQARREGLETAARMRQAGRERAAARTAAAAAAAAPSSRLGRAKKQRERAGKKQKS